MAAHFHTDWQTYEHYGFIAYRIWMRETSHGISARHEWLRADGSSKVDEWHNAHRDSIPAGYKPAQVEEAA